MLGKYTVRVNADGQLEVIEVYIGEEIKARLSRKASLAIARKVVEAQGLTIADPVEPEKGGTR